MPDRVGQQLGNYRLIRLLGRGGFAEVYLGQHLWLSIQAAIKVLHTQLADDDVENFHHEAQTIASLVHPHIVRVLDFDTKDGVPFLVMDYAPNGALRRLHPKGIPLPLSAIVSYVRQVADALQYAHDKKFIHRDVKPENMLLGQRNEVLLSDFGIATIAHNTSSLSIQTMAGTVPYMAPEQIQAHPRPASDQYSLGVVVYEWLCGERPFQGSQTEIALKHSLVAPPPLREKVPTILPEVEQVVLTALAKDPKERFVNVQAFATALEQAGQSFLAFSPKPSSKQPSLSLSMIAPPGQPPLPSGPNTQPSTIPELFSLAIPPSKPRPPKRGVSRRAVLVGLVGLAVASGGITWLLLTTGGSGNLVTITGAITSVDAANHSVTLRVNGQSITVKGLTDQQVAALQGKVGKTSTLQAMQNSDGTYTINAGTNLTVENGTPTATQAPSPTATPIPVAFKPGGISFIGPVKSISSSSLVMSAPNGQTYTIAITAQTDRSAFGGNLPTVGTSVDMDSTVNQDGSLTATILKPAQPGDPALNNIAYTGVTTSAVGADRVLHFTVGIKSYTYTIPTTADLTNFGGNAQAIGNNITVIVKVQYPSNTVVSVG